MLRMTSYEAYSETAPLPSAARLISFIPKWLQPTDYYINLTSTHDNQEDNRVTHRYEFEGRLPLHPPHGLSRDLDAEPVHIELTGKGYERDSGRIIAAQRHVGGVVVSRLLLICSAKQPTYITVEESAVTFNTLADADRELYDTVAGSLGRASLPLLGILPPRRIKIQ